MRGYLRENENLLLSLEAVINPGHTALLVIDMQNDFVHGRGKTGPVPGKPLNDPQQMLPNLIKFVHICRKVKIPIFWILTSHGRDLDLPSYKARMARNNKMPPVMEGTKGAALVKGLAPKKSERIFVKHSYDGFTDTDLNTALRNKGIATIILSGVNTNTCVDATLKHGFHLGYYVVAGSDIMAASVKGVQDTYLNSFGKNYGLVATGGEMAKIWGL